MLPLLKPFQRWATSMKSARGTGSKLFQAIELSMK
jgi:hypothetical protein